jgi:Cu2+-containing amine oxidase
LATPRAPLTPLVLQQSADPSVRVAGNEITWDRWRLRVGVDPRRGLEIHDVSFEDGARRRSVLYSGSVSEIVAPYGDPTFSTWYPRDEGDYGMGIYSMTSAVTLNDVPANGLPRVHDDDHLDVRSRCHAPSPSMSATAESSGDTRTCRGEHGSSSSAPVHDR